jgi:hypothetical protein
VTRGFAVLVRRGIPNGAAARIVKSWNRNKSVEQIVRDWKWSQLRSREISYAIGYLVADEFWWEGPVDGWPRPNGYHKEVTISEEQAEKAKQHNRQLVYETQLPKLLALGMSQKDALALIGDMPEVSGTYKRSLPRSGHRLSAS